MDQMIFSLFTAIGLIFSLWKVMGSKLFKFESFLDLAFTFGLPMLLIGSFAASASALTIGIFVSILLFSMKKLRHTISPQTINQDKIDWAFVRNMYKKQ